MSQPDKSTPPPSQGKIGHEPPPPRIGPRISFLPLCKKYLKTVGMLCGVWAVGYFRFSVTWMLIPPFFYMLNEEYRKTKAMHKMFAKEAAVDEKSAVLNRIDELPKWVFFPDVERAEWLNKIIKQMWPYIGKYVKDLLKTSVEGQISSSLPEVLQPFRFETIDLGDSPPRIGGVKVYIENIERDEIILDLEVFMASDTNIKVALRGKSAGIKDLMIHGQLRVVMNLCDKMPIIGGLNVFFLNQPTVDFDLTNYANLLDLPLLSNSLRSVIQDQLNYYLVLPNKIPILLVDKLDLDVQRLHYPMPQGVLRLHMVSARELKRADFKLIGKGKSDPYCNIFVGAQTFKTKVIENTINPVWNSYFEAVVDQKHGQFVEIEVLDQDPGEDDQLGTASIDIQNVSESGTLDTWLPLENVETGMIHVRAIWLYLSKEATDLEKAVQSNQDEELITVSEDHLSSALLIVNLDSAKSLPRYKKSMAEPSPYVKLSMGNTVQKSVTMAKTTDPKWEENFQFLVHDPRNQDLLLEIFDSRYKKKVLDGGARDKKLGVLHVPLKSLLTMPDMTINQTYQLRQSGPGAKINLRLVLRILNPEQQVWVQTADHVDETDGPDALDKPASPSADQKSKKGAPLPSAPKKEPIPQSPVTMSEKNIKDKRYRSPEKVVEKVPDKVVEKVPADKVVEKVPVMKKGSALKERVESPARSVPDVLSSEEPLSWNAPVGDEIETPISEPTQTATASMETAVRVSADSTSSAKPTEKMDQTDDVSEPNDNSNNASEQEKDVSDDVSEQEDASNNASAPMPLENEFRQRNVLGAASDLGLGRLQLTLRYSSQRSRLIAVIHKCINLIPCDEDNLADPYIRIYLLPDRSSNSKRKTQVVKNNLQPIYDETFEWSLPLHETKQRMLDIQIKNKNSMFSKARVHMGQVIINLADIDLTQASTEWYELEDPAEDTFKDD